MPRACKPRPPLTDRKIQAAKPPPSGRTELIDGRVEQLVLRVSAGGSKTFSVAYFSPTLPQSPQDGRSVGPGPREVGGDVEALQTARTVAGAGLARA